MPELVFFRRGDEVLRFSIDKPKVVLGRGEQCDVSLPDPEISRAHVELTVDAKGACSVKDLSGKGTLVAGQRVTSGALADGADLSLGQWRAVYRASASRPTSVDSTEVGARTELAATGEREDTAQAQVRVRTASGESQHRLQLDSFVAGSDPSCDLALAHKFISSKHVKISRRDGNRFHVIDQHSTNGTWVGPVRVFEAEVPFFTPLRLGETELVIEPWGVGKQGGAPAGGLLGNDPAVRQLIEFIERVAPSSAAVAIFGESGTGKELVAQALHARSLRPAGPFVPVNCAAISKELIESELFGHEKGAFTGALNARKGAFEEADGGTLFLDEIGELPLELQAKLLRALESGEIKRVGSSRPQTVDVRVVAATNRNLLGMAKAGKFREDLYYRLCVVPLRLPPLRARGNDLLLLAEHFLRQFSPKGSAIKLTPSAVERIKAHTWPGNIRELRNVIHRALLLRKGPQVDGADIVVDEAPKADEGEPIGGYVPGLSLEEHLARFERQVVEGALEHVGHNREKAAKELGVARATLFKRLKDWGFTGSA